MNATGLKRLKSEYTGLCKDPIPNAIAYPEPLDWFKWHFALYDLDSPFEGGVYHGELRFPSNYPFGPPAILMHTPNGRFAVNKRICTSMSDYHKETWSPAWRVSTIILGLISFMMSDEASTGTVITSVSEKRRLARLTHTTNLNNVKFLELFSADLEKLYPQQGSLQEPVSNQSGQPNNSSSRSGYIGALVFLVLAVYLFQRFS